MKSKNAIKKLKKQLNAEVIELANAIKEDREYIAKVQSEKDNQYDFLLNITNSLKSDLKHHESKIKEVFDFTQSIARHLGYAETEIKTIAKHVQNLEAEKEEKCSCKTYYTPMSAIDLISNPEYTINHTNTQKTDKNATEGKRGGENRIWEPLPNHIPVVKFSATTDETIVTNEMFNEELERFLNEEGYVLPSAKYTSTDNSSRFISTMIYDLYTVTRLTATNDIIRSKLKSKGEHYNKESDRYANIKDALNRNKEEQPHLFANWTVVDKINSYKDKHIQWLIDTKGTEQAKVDLQEAYIDVICYCIMAYIYLKFNGEA